MAHVPSPERRGTIAFAIVAATIAVLFVVLPRHDDTPPPPPAAASSTTAAPTTTLEPLQRLCKLADQFVADAKDLPPNQQARLAEVFYTRARDLVDGSYRAEVDAAARYYQQYNAIGEPLDYDLFRIVASPDGDRWLQLVLRPPVGVDNAASGIAYLCQVELPPPPTITTTTTTRYVPPTTEQTATTGSVSPGSTLPTATTATTAATATTVPATVAPATSR